MLLTQTCKTCNKPIKNIQTEIPSGNFITYVWGCGHIEVKIKSNEVRVKHNIFSPSALPQTQKSIDDYIVPSPTHEELYNDLEKWVNEGGSFKKTTEMIASEERWAKFQSESFHSIDGSDKHSYEYQFECVEFGEAARCCFLNADAVGVGKTIETSIILKRNLEVLRPILILVPGSLVFQWANEIRTWIAKKINTVMPVMKREHLMPGFDIYVMSRDLLGRKDVLNIIAKLKIKALVIDEAHAFKDAASQRTKALVKLIKDNNIQFKMPLSGTWIKNRFSESYVIMNMIDPVHWPDQASINKFCYGDKLNPYRLDDFKRITGNYIIRREKHEVLKDLPALTRDYQLIEIEDPGIKDSYNHQLGLFESFLNNKNEEITSQKLLGWLAKLRAITGMAKTSFAVDWINEFLESSDESIAISIHHNNVRELLYNVFSANKLNPLSLSGADNSYQKDRIVNDFNNGKNRILVINALAGGIGLNLQSCANALVLERQWNSADEEQFEGRFHRNGQKKGVTVTYLIAKGTIDEFFHDMVYNKRNILASVGIGGFDDTVNSLQGLKEFSEFVASHKI